MTTQIETREKLLDETGWRILYELQMDARLSYAELGRRVGLTAPAVMERVKRLEEAGVIKGYHAEIDLKQVGAPVLAFVRIRNTGSNSGHIEDLLKAMPCVLECHHVMGEDCLVVKIAVPNIEALQGFFDQIKPLAMTTTSIVLSSPLTHRVICEAMVYPMGS